MRAAFFRGPSTLCSGILTAMGRQEGVGQRLTMSSKISTFSRSRLFSSSSCWFRLRKRCSSLRSPVKLPDSWRKEGGQNTDCHPTVATLDQSKLIVLYLKPSGHFRTSGSGQQGSLWGSRIPGPAQPHGWIYPAAGRKSHSEFHRIPQSHPLLSHFYVTGIPVEDAGPNGPGAWNPTLVITAAVEDWLFSLPSLHLLPPSPTHSSPCTWRPLVRSFQ